jgi:hypothetical protein
MIHQLVKSFQRIDRDIEALTYVLVALLLIVVTRSVLFVYKCQYDQLWALLAPTTTLLTTLLVVRVANRLIVNSNIIREDERRQEIVRTTHHLIAITQDLRARVGYVKTMLSEGGRPTLALSQIVTTIEDRYETLLERDAYKLLPGKCVDIITGISGDIFGIGLIAGGIKHMATENPAITLLAMPSAEIKGPEIRLEALMAELQELLDELFKLRASIDAERQKS